MDQNALVIDAGYELIRRFHKCVPVKAAFWVKPIDSEQWDLYIASEKIDDANLRSRYSEVLEVVRDVQNPNLDPFQVKLVSADDPIAREVVAIQQRSPVRNIPISYHGTVLGDINIEGGYFYPDLDAPSLVQGEASPNPAQ